MAIFVGGERLAIYQNETVKPARLQQHEMAWRMLTSILELRDLSNERESVFEQYGANSRRPGSYASKCILARRLVERGVARQGDWQSPEGGRDHHPRCYTMWMAGGGIRSGITYGATDDFSYNVAETPVHFRDLHATALHLMSIDHERFTYLHQGLDFKLTGVEHARIVSEILT